MIAATDVLAYALALGLAVAIPGPGIAALVARTVSGGTVAGYAMLTGLIIGDLVYLTFAVLGLGLLAQTFGSVFIIIRWVSVVYLMFLAWQFWTAERHDITTSDHTQKSLCMACAAGLAITLSNPKAIAFYLALLPVVLDLQHISVSILTTVLAPVAILVLLIVGSVYILGAISVRRALSSAKAQQRLYRTAAAAMAGAAFSLVAREL